MAERSFRALVGAQFFGAFNDNLFKQLILFLAAAQLFPGEDKQGLAFAVFALPFVIFSGLAGDLSERLSKRRIVVAMKGLEIVLMAVGAFALQARSWPFLLAMLFFMGLQSAFFGPSKYGVIPELVAPDRLMRANGTIAMTTFMAILLGQALAGPLLDGFGDALWITGAACTAFAVVGAVIALGMAPLEPMRPDLRIRPNPFGSLFETISALRRQEGLFGVVVLNSMFWFDGGVVQQAIAGMGAPEWLAIPTDQSRLLSYLLVTLAVGIIVGSLLAPVVARRVAPGRLVIAGAVAMVTGQLALLSIGTVFGPSQSYVAAHGILAWIGLSGAFFVVPVQTYLQSGPPEGMRGQTFAVNNFMNFLFIFLGGAWYLVARQPSLLDLGPTMTQALAGGGLLVALGLNARNIRRMNSSL